MEHTEEVNEDGFAPRKPFWRCESCGFEDHKKPMPPDRVKFYNNPKPYKCSKCKSNDVMPVGF